MKCDEQMASRVGHSGHAHQGQDRIVIFGDVHGELYGAQRSLLQLSQQWIQQGRYRIHFVSSGEGLLCQAFREMGITTTALRVGRLLGSYNKKLLNLRWWEYPGLAVELFSFSRLLRRILLDQRAVLLHCNNDRVGLMGFVAARWARCPMVTHIRRDRGFGRLDRIIYRGTNEIVWVSERIRREFGERNGIAEPKGRVIYNGRELPDADAPSTRQELLAEFSLPSDAFITLVLAGFDPRKDHETLIAAAKIACAAEPRLYVLLAGMDTTPDQARQRRIEELVKEADLESRVRFLGHREDANRLLRGADLLVNPAREEALGGALIEAIGYGVPVVATDTGGTAEIVPDGECGLLVDRQDHEALANRMVALLHDEKRRRRFSQNARQRFARHFTAARCAERTASFFDEIIRNNRRKGR